MVKLVVGLVVLQTLDSVPLTLPIGLSELWDKHLVFLELVDNGFMEEEFDVFNKVKSPGCCGALVNLLLVFGFMGINALQDTQPPEVGQAQLQLLPGFVSGDVVGGRASFVFLLLQASHSSTL